MKQSRVMSEKICLRADLKRSSRRGTLVLGIHDTDEPMTSAADKADFASFKVHYNIVLLTYLLR